MAEKKFKTKDMIIAVICTLLTILGIVFYFLPAFSVQHTPSLSFDDGETLYYSGWQMTQALFIKNTPLGTDIAGLIFIKDVFGMAIALSGILLPLSLICAVATTVFAYLSWFKGEQFKKFCFLFSLCGMVFSTIALISTWFIAIQLRTGKIYIDYFNSNVKGSIAYASFVSLILSFVIAIVACAYNYFLDNFDDEEYEEDEDEEDEEEEEEEVKPRKKTVVVQETAPARKTSTAKNNTSAKSTTTKSTTTAAKKPAAKKTTTKVEATKTEKKK